MTKQCDTQPFHGDIQIWVEKYVTEVRMQIWALHAQVGAWAGGGRGEGGVMAAELMGQVRKKAGVSSGDVSGELSVDDVWRLGALREAAVR